MNRNSIKDLKNIFSAKERLTLGQQLNIKGGGGEDDEDKRRDGARCAGTGTGTGTGTTTTTDPKATTPAIKPGI
jgi:hypothetical protein